MESGGTLQEWGGRRAVMEALPAMDCYEDMFKEITRKLYGEDGIQDMEGDHGVLRSSDCDTDPPDGHNALAAFGLAALMQNGFPPPPGMFGHHHHLTESGRGRSGEDKWVASEETLQWTSSKIATYNAAQRLFRCTECECVGFLSRVAEHWLGTHANLRVFQCPSCPYASAWARCVRMHLQRQHNITDTTDNLTDLLKENPVLEEVTKYLQRLKTRVETPAQTPTMKTEFPTNQQQQHSSPPARQTVQPTGSENTPSKRYCCTFCPYATDRRDLFTRHENIHRDEKPFQCYVCQKQFNRADHVKKHFLRMHRDHPYDLNRIRRPATKSSNGINYYDKYPQNSPHQTRPQTLAPQGQVHHGLNIPAGFSPPPTIMRGLKPNIHSPKIHPNGCNAKSHGSKSGKKKGDKRYSCCYCTWSGVDNWCLKRHLNTHLKPFICALCDYKAARSERLATHVLKVHNKRACGRCSYLAEDSAQLAIHIQDHHPLDHRSSSRAPGNVLRTANIPNAHVPPNHHSIPYGSHDGSQTSGAPLRRHPEESHGVWNPHNHLQPSYPIPEETWRTNKHYGAARLFHYMEVSDTSEPENEPENEPEEDPPPFICRECGCEFVDDTSLETHVFMHHRAVKQENLKPIDKYATSSMTTDTVRHQDQGQLHRKKQLIHQNKREEMRIYRLSPGKRHRTNKTFQKLRKRCVTELILRQRFRCGWCRIRKDSFNYHTKSSLALHRLWRHRHDRFGCEHCSARFRHRYQVVIHSSRNHITKTPPVSDQENTLILRLEPQQQIVIPNYYGPIHEYQFTIKTQLPPLRTLQEIPSNKPYLGRPEDHEDKSVSCNLYVESPNAPVALVVPSYPPSA